MLSTQTGVTRLLALTVALVFSVAAQTADAKRIIQGQIKDDSGKPVKGLLVKAWDSDGATSGDDFMGQAYTDANGRYRISYRGGHWDPYPHNITKWRPDIYVKVLVYADGHWIRTAKSRVYSDHKLRDDLTINLGVASNKDVTRFTRFKPRYHALPFENKAYKVCAAPTCKGEHVGAIFKSILQFDWALCGGMSLTALEHYRMGKKPPEFSPKVKETLVKNQMRTLSPSIWAKFIEWQAKPTQPHATSPHTIGYSTKGEWPKVKQAIDVGAPIILGLIRNQDATGGGVSKNHQALAVGYTYNRLTTKVTIYLYDPNYCPKSLGPDCNFSDAFSTFTFYTGIPRNQIKAVFKRPDGKVVPRARGFFVIREGSGPPRTVYQPDTSVKKPTVAAAISKPPTGMIRSKVIRSRGIEPQEAEYIEEEIDTSAEALAAFEEALESWGEEDNDAAALERIAQIDAARERQVTTRSLEEGEGPSEELMRLISPDQLDDPPPP